MVARPMSFSVLAIARPLRAAFLFVDTNGFDVACDGLLTWCLSNWGGRHSSITLLQEGHVSDDDFGELIRFDPDYV